MKIEMDEFEQTSVEAAFRGASVAYTRYREELAAAQARIKPFEMDFITASAAVDNLTRAVCKRHGREAPADVRPTVDLDDSGKPTGTVSWEDPETVEVPEMAGVIDG